MNIPKYSYHKIIFVITICAIISCGSDNPSIENPVTSLDPNFTRTIEWIETFGGSNEDNILSLVETNDGDMFLQGIHKVMMVILLTKLLPIVIIGS